MSCGRSGEQHYLNNSEILGAVGLAGLGHSRGDRRRRAKDDGTVAGSAVDVHQDLTGEDGEVVRQVRLQLVKLVVVRVDVQPAGTVDPPEQVKRDL